MQLPAAANDSFPHLIEHSCKLQASMENEFVDRMEVISCQSYGIIMLEIL